METPILLGRVVLAVPTAEDLRVLSSDNFHSVKEQLRRDKAMLGYGDAFRLTHGSSSLEAIVVQCEPVAFGAVGDSSVVVVVVQETFKSGERRASTQQVEGFLPFSLFSPLFPRHLNSLRDGREIASLIAPPSRQALLSLLPEMSVTVLEDAGDFDGDTTSVAFASLDGLRRLALPTGTWVRDAVYSQRHP
jgi:hypothetical protein